MNGEHIEATGLHLEIQQTHPQFFVARVRVPAPVVDKLYKEASLTQKNFALTQGFSRGNTPIQYIETAYKNHILNHLQEFIFKYLVVGFLYEELRAKKALFAGDPQIKDIRIEPAQDAYFTFEFTVPESLSLRGWKYYAFKPPKRKNYRDLDRQVENFIKVEEESAQKLNANAVQVNDWICFDISLVDQSKNPLFTTWHNNVWLKIGNEEVDIPFQELFAGKKLGEQFFSSADCLQEYFSSQLDTNYLFSITIKDIVSDGSFSIEDFKTSFRIRTNKEMHKKLIEVFSYRNDISQRRETVEEVFKLLLNQHKFQAPVQLVLRRQQALLDMVHENPDYQVYRMQKDFEEHVRQLAEKQVRETILIDQLAFKENITVNHQDIKHYLNLIKRPRTREFVYFDLPTTRKNGQEMPIPSELLKQYALREKALNYIIYHLTRK